MAANDLPSRMSRRRPTSAAPQAVQPEADIETPPPLVEVPRIEPAASVKPVRPFRVATKPYPHRVSLDLDEATYTWLRDVAHENRIQMGALVRELLGGIVRRDEELLAAAVRDTKGALERTKALHRKLQQAKGL